MKMPKLLDRIGHVALWRYIRWVHPLADRLSVRWGRAARLARWPIPPLAPYRRLRLDVVRRVALGDILLCTPALREVKRLNPACQVTFYTTAAYQDLAASCPFIDRVRSIDEAPPDAVWMFYESAMRRPIRLPDGTVPPDSADWKTIQPHRPLACILGDSLGVDVKDVRPSCAVDPAEVDRFRRAWKDLPRPWVLIVREAGGFTRNKDWPNENWEALLDRLLTRCTIIEVGAECREDRRPRPEPQYVDLVGRTTLPRFIAAIAAADLHIGPITGSVHIAAAVGTPSVVIYGGYEHPRTTAYPGNINLYSPVECAPCWLRTPCPHARKCLHQITPDQVEAAVDALWGDGRRSHPDRAADRPGEGRPIDPFEVDRAEPGPGAPSTEISRVHRAGPVEAGGGS
jgi:ADP-heptose:LPS heptosyltransferase